MKRNAGNIRINFNFQVKKKIIAKLHREFLFSFFFSGRLPDEYARKQGVSIQFSYEQHVPL